MAGAAPPHDPNSDELQPGSAAQPTHQKPDPAEDRARKRRKTAGYAIASAILVACTAVGSILVEFPPSWPQTLWGALLLFFGASLLLFTTLVTPFLSEFAERIARSIERLPESVRRRASTLKRQPTRLVTAVLVAVVVVATAAIVRPPASPLDLEPGEMTILTAFDESPGDPRRILIDQWNLTHPNNRVKIEDVPGEPDQQHERLVNDAKAGGSHQADVFVLDIVWMPEFIRNDYIRPLNESWQSSDYSDFVPTVLDTCRDLYGGKKGMWGLPLNSDAGLLFYRSGQAKPASWDDYYGSRAKAALARARTDPAVPDSLQAADAGQFADEEILTISALEAIWAAGGQVVNKDGKLVLNEDSSAVVFDNNAREGLKKLAAAYEDRELTLPDAATADEDTAVTAFRDGKTLFMRNWPVAYDKLRTSSGNAGIPFEVAPLPSASVLGGQNLAISKWTDKPRAAQAFIEYLTNPASQLILFEIGGFAPTRDTAYASISLASRPYGQDLRNAVERARRRPVTPKYIAFSSEFRQGVLRALRNGGEFEPDFPQRLAASVKE